MMHLFLWNLSLNTSLLLAHIRCWRTEKFINRDRQHDYMKRARYRNLVALCLSDGGIGFSSGTRYIHFTNQSETLLKFFENEIRKFSDAKIHRQIKERGITLRVFDINLVRELLSISPNFRTKSCNNYPKCKPGCLHELVDSASWPIIHIPEDLFGTKNDKTSFLKIYASCDGYPSIFPRSGTWSPIERIVAIVCHHPKLKLRLSELLDDVEIPHTIKRYSLEMRSRDAIEKFTKKIKFLDGVEMTGNSRHWKGYKKNDILFKIVKSYKTRFEQKDSESVLKKLRNL